VCLPAQLFENLTAWPAAEGWAGFDTYPIFRMRSGFDAVSGSRSASLSFLVIMIPLVGWRFRARQHATKQACSLCENWSISSLASVASFFLSLGGDFDFSFFFFYEKLMKSRHRDRRRWGFCTTTVAEKFSVMIGPLVPGPIRHSLLIGHHFGEDWYPNGRDRVRMGRFGR